MGLNKFQQNANLNNLEKKIIYITKKESIRYKYYIKTKDNGCEMDAQKIYNIYYNFLIKQNFFQATGFKANYFLTTTTKFLIYFCIIYFGYKIQK